MTNPQNLLFVHPDTSENFFIILEEEEYTSIVNMTDVLAQAQSIRGLYTRYQDSKNTKFADLNELRDAKVAAALVTIDNAILDVNTDLANISAATAVQVRAIVGSMLQREKQSRQREKAVIKALMHLTQ